MSRILVAALAPDASLDEAQKRPWHALEPAAAADALDVDVERGLEDDEVERRRETVGPNELPRREPPGLLRIILRQFQDPLVYILLIAAAVSLITGNVNNAIFIGAVLLLNATVGTLQEHRAEHSAGALQSAVDIEAQVWRDGRKQSLPATALVPGDVIEVEAGDAVPADARLLEATGLAVDESLLTGESRAVDKDATASLQEDTALGDRETMLHAGSTVQGGRGRGVVGRTGSRTELGRIASSLAEGEAQVPPLVVRLKRLTRMIAVFVLGAVALLAVVQLWRGAAWLDIFFLTVALSVSAIPAGLPVAITVALSVAARRMAERDVIVRQLPAVEGLGACTLIASDKTGTLTANVLTVKRVDVLAGEPVAIDGEGYDLEAEALASAGPLGDDVHERVHALARAGALCNEGALEVEDGEVTPQGDRTDAALLALAHKLDLDPDGLRHEAEVRATVPFASDQRYAAVFCDEDDGTVAYVKGAFEVVADMCRPVDDAADRERSLAEGGYRVLALARGVIADGVDLDEAPREALKDLELLGLVGLVDPIREGVPDALERSHEAGVEVRMVTGDHPATGLAVARELGIADDGDRAVTGQELADGGDDAIRDARVFARVEPTQKTQIVERLQDEGHFVAVTGDGANDAPALRSAHIGVAMGEAGTDVARGVADLILTDDDFSSIVDGIEEGRIAYDNVRKVVWLLLATGAAEVLLFFLALAFDMAIPLLPVQLLWLNLVTNGIQDVALAFERGEPDVLRRSPRDPDEPIVDRQMIEQVVASGLYMGTVAFAGYAYLTRVQGMDVAPARNLVLLLMVLFENVHIFSCRSERRSVFQVSLRDNPLLIGTVAAAQGIHILALHLPPLQRVLELEPVTVSTWLWLLPVALSLLVFDELLKLVRRRL